MENLTPEQKQAIRNMTTNRRRQLRDPHLPASSFPKFVPGMSTAQYVDLYRIYRGSLVLDVGCENYSKPAPMLDPMFPEVIEEPNN